MWNGLSDGHVDGVTVASRRADAIFMILKFGNVRKRTLRQRRFNLRHAAGREDRCEVERLDEGDVVGADDLRFRRGASFLSYVVVA